MHSLRASSRGTVRGLGFLQRRISSSSAGFRKVNKSNKQTNKQTNKTADFSGRLLHFQSKFKPCRNFSQTCRHGISTTASNHEKPIGWCAFSKRIFFSTLVPGHVHRYPRRRDQSWRKLQRCLFCRYMHGFWISCVLFVVRPTGWVAGVERRS